MENAGYVNLTHQMAVRRLLDVTSNNIANMNTDGFKSDKVLFSTIVETKSKREGPDHKIHYGSADVSYMDLSPGPIEMTGNALDLAIQGDGYFSYQGDAGETLYSRDGRLTIDGFGRLTNMSGRPVLDNGGGEIVLANTDISTLAIAKDGTISSNGDIVGQIGISTFDIEQGFEKRGENMLVPIEGNEPLPALASSVIQGGVERSNVNAIVEMTRLIEVNRAYGQASRISDTLNDLQKKGIQDIGRKR